jgi:hypothetical protein
MLKYAIDNFTELTPNNSDILPLKIHTDSLSKKREDTSPDVNFSIIGSLNPYFKDVSLIEKVLFKLSNENYEAF